MQLELKPLRAILHWLLSSFLYFSVGIWRVGWELNWSREHWLHWKRLELEVSLLEGWEIVGLLNCLRSRVRWLLLVLIRLREGKYDGTYREDRENAMIPAFPPKCSLLQIDVTPSFLHSHPTKPYPHPSAHHMGIPIRYFPPSPQWFLLQNPLSPSLHF